MKKAAKGETYYCTVCGCEVVCTTESESPIVCCEEVMYVI
ncbi:MAG: desulforedoxin [Candidatus Methanoperedens sp.]|nr:desulforedoxin [Candidatus Methanoperedens sp.]